VIILLVVVFYILSQGRIFLPINIRQIFNGMVITSFFTLGVGMLILFGYIDLSVGAVGSLSGCAMAWLMVKFNVPIAIAFTLGVIVASACGFINALMVNKLHFEPFIATLAMASIAHGFGYNMATGEGLPVSHPVTKWIGSFKLFDNLLPVTVIIAVVFFVIYGVILAKTKFGRAIYICGGNKQAARLAGLKPTKLSYILFTNCGFLAGICGILVTSRTGSAMATVLDSYQFTGLTAAMLGGIAFGGGSGDMLGCFLGMLILALFNNGVIVLGLDRNLAQIFNGILLVVALALDAISARRQMKGWIKKSLLEDADSK
jgi:ribose/xylose/arabinose/galactoside ABC-type transport system permease subunit